MSFQHDTHSNTKLYSRWTNEKKSTGFVSRLHLLGTSEDLIPRFISLISRCCFATSTQNRTQSIFRLFYNTLTGRVCVWLTLHELNWQTYSWQQNPFSVKSLRVIFPESQNELWALNSPGKVVGLIKNTIRLITIRVHSISLAHFLGKLRVNVAKNDNEYSNSSGQ